MNVKELHIAVYVPTLNGGGAERVMVTLANGLSRSGARVDLIVVDGTGPYRNSVDREVRLLKLAGKRAAFSLPSLISYFLKNRPSILISAMPAANVVSILLKMLSFGHLRVIVTEHNNIRHVNDGRWRRRLLLGAMKIYRYSDVVVGVSQGVADEISRSLSVEKKRLKVIYNPIEVDRVRALSLLDAPQIEEGRGPVILFVGRFTAQKDPITLLRAFHMASRKRPMQLVMLGTGELEPELRREIDGLDLGESVLMPGFVANPYAYMRRASVLVLCSRWEGFGNVLVEAMACGTAVISTDCPSGPSEILQGGRWGKLVPVGSAPDLARAINETLDCPANDVSARADDFSVSRALAQYWDSILDT